MFSYSSGGLSGPSTQLRVRGLRMGSSQSEQTYRSLPFVLSSAASFIGLPQSGQGFRIEKSIVIGLPLPSQHSSFRRCVSRPAPKNCVQELYRDTGSRSRRSPPSGAPRGARFLSKGAGAYRDGTVLTIAD